MDLKHLNTKSNTIVIGGKYTLQERLGGGSFGQIYSATTKSNKSLIAIKLEQRVATKNPTLPREAKIMQEFTEEIGFPAVYGYGKEESLNYLAMDLLGLNLEKLLKICGRQFSLKTVLMLADQMLTRIELLHQKGFLHRDIKPDNFCIGTDDKTHHLYIIDFGLARSYKEYNGQHIAYREKKSLVGTARYASINTHLGIEQSRRDDLESIGYTLIYFLKGELPWQNIKTNDKQEKYKMIADIKMKTSVETLCKDLPEEFAAYMNHVRGLGFTDIPNYKFLKRLFRTLFIQNNFLMDYDFDWSDLLTETSSKNDKKKKSKKKNITQAEIKSGRKKEEDAPKETQVKKNNPEPKKEEAKGTLLIDSLPLDSTAIRDSKENNINSKDKKLTHKESIFMKTKTAGIFKTQTKGNGNGNDISYKNGSTTSGDSFKALDTGESEDADVPNEFFLNDFPSMKMDQTRSVIARKKDYGNITKRNFMSLGLGDDHSRIGTNNKMYQTCPTGNPDDSKISGMKKSEDFDRMCKKSIFRIGKGQL